MGYFSNGTEGLFYQENFCFRCQNFRGEPELQGCPAWDAHLLFDLTENADLLDLFIPRDGIHNKQCTMFLEEVKP